MSETDDGVSESTETSEESSEESIEGESQEPAKKEAAPKDEQKIESMIRKLKLKIDGQEIEEDYDLSNMDQLIKDIQMSRVAKKRMAEAHEAKKKAYELAQRLEDPKELFKGLGDKAYQTAEELIWERIQQEKMTPEQRELHEYKRKVQEYEQREKMNAEKAKQEEEQRLEAQQLQIVQKTIIEALQKALPGMEKSPKLAKRCAFFMKENLRLGLGLSSDDIAQEVREEWIKENQETLSMMDDDQLLRIFGDKNIKRLRKKDLETLKSKGKMKSLTQSSAPKPQPKQKYMRPDEWLASLDERMKSIKD